MHASGLRWRGRSGLIPERLRGQVSLVEGQIRDRGQGAAFETAPIRGLPA